MWCIVCSSGVFVSSAQPGGPCFPQQGLCEGGNPHGMWHGDRSVPHTRNGAEGVRPRMAAPSSPGPMLHLSTSGHKAGPQAACSPSAMPRRGRGEEISPPPGFLQVQRGCRELAGAGN